MPIKEVLRTTPSLDTFYTALELAGLSDYFSGKGPFTFLAPTNDAFTKYPTILEPDNRVNLNATLLLHVIPRILEQKDIPQNLTGYWTVGGYPIYLYTSDYGTPGNTHIWAHCYHCLGKWISKSIKSDITTNNGVIHIMDRLLYLKLN